MANNGVFVLCLIDMQGTTCTKSNNESSLGDFFEV